MPDPAMLWSPRGAWEGVVRAGTLGPSTRIAGVTATPLDGFGLASVILRDGQGGALRSAMASRWALEPPTAPRLARGHGCDLVWSGPGQWLAVSPERDIAARLATHLAGIAAVSDQSDARAVLRLSGPRARDALAKGCSVDLHPRAFRIGDVALTSIAHVGVQLWQADDGPTYDLAVFRSMAASFWSWFAASAAEFGCEIARVPAPD